MQRVLRMRLALLLAALAGAVSCDGSTDPPPVATRLEFIAQPSNAVAGASISPAVQVRVLDDAGGVFTGPMTVRLALAPANGAALLGTTSAATTNGMATFSDLRIEKAGSGYALTASSGSLSAATSNAFDVAHAAPAKLRFVGQPGQTQAGRPFTPAVTVEITDEYDNRAASATNRVTIAVAGGDAGGVVTGTGEVGAVSGLATFDRITLNVPGSYTLRASSVGLPHVTSGSFVVQPTPVARFCPPDVASGAAFDNFLAATVSAERGGTIVVCDGTHFLTDVSLRRPVTVRAEHPHAATLSTATGTALIVWGEGGRYTIRDLNFTVTDDGVAVGVGKNVADPAMTGYQEVIIENNRFTMTSGRGRGVAVGGSSDVPGGKVILRSNTFTGGMHGFHGITAGAVDVVENTFKDQVSGGAFSTGNIELRGGGPYLVRNNLITGCSAVCVNGTFGPVAEISYNIIETTVERGTRNGIDLVLANATVLRNLIRGVGPVANRGDPSSYAFKGSGIFVQLPGSSVTLDGNSISHANSGIYSNDAPIVGTNNIVTLVGLAVGGTGAPPQHHRSDFSDYVAAVGLSSGAPEGSLSCNYWGRPHAPDVPPTVLPLITPFSVVPIANRNDVKCP